MTSVRLSKNRILDKGADTIMRRSPVSVELSIGKSAILYERNEIGSDHSLRQPRKTVYCSRFNESNLGNELSFCSNNSSVGSAPEKGKD